jgi:transcriptional regulator with XRE-family HTH domain
MTSDSYSVETGSRIREARRALQMTQKDFAASLGIVQGFLSGIETGRKTPSDTLLIALTHTHGIDLQWLKQGTGTPFSAAPAGAAARQGGSAPLLEDIPEEFPPANQHEGSFISLPNLPQGCYAVTCRGDFMAPTIRDGDLVIFTPAGTPKSGDIILVHNRWAEPILRRYRLKGDEVLSLIHISEPTRPY